MVLVEDVDNHRQEDIFLFCDHFRHFVFQVGECFRDRIEVLVLQQCSEFLEHAANLIIDTPHDFRRGCDAFVLHNREDGVFFAGIVLIEFAEQIQLVLDTFFDFRLFCFKIDSQ